jgi:galactose mutarotase-like enzyme
MWEIRNETDGYEVLELLEPSTGSWCKLAPARGGIAFSLGLNGKELFYLNPETFYDPEANVRGGNPVLFPICGPLSGGEYRLGERTYAMKQHGFARNHAWKVTGTSTSDGAQAVLNFRSSEATKALYPFAFEIKYTYRLKDGELFIVQEYVNLSEEAMPFYAGLHPYFRTSLHHVTVRMGSAGEKSYVLAPLQEAVILEAGDCREVTFSTGENEAVALGFSSAFRYIVLWSEPGKPFVCVEPWMAKPDALNTREEIVWIQPNEPFQAEVTIRRFSPADAAEQTANVESFRSIQ